MIESRAVTIQVGSSSYHSINDLGLYIGNYDCVKEPKVDTHFVTIPGRDGYIDLSEAIAGRPIYTERDIEIEFGSLKTPSTWPAQISQIYNYFHGKTIRLIFDDDTDWYYEGRAAIEGFAFFRQVGVFTLKVKAKPYKYGVNIQPGLADLSLSNSTYKNQDIPITLMPVCPEFVVSDMSSGTVNLRIASGYPGYGWSEAITANGTYQYSALRITESTRIQAKGPTGTKLSIVYRQGSI